MRIVFTVSTKSDAPRGWFSGSLRRVAVLSPYRSAPGGRAEPAFSPGTTEYPPQPMPRSRTRRRRPRCSDPEARPRSIRSRRLQGRRPYEPSVRRDGGSVAQGSTWSGRTVRETVGVLKGLGNAGTTILSVPFDPSSSSDLIGGSVRAGDQPLRVTPILGSSPRMTKKEERGSAQRTQRGHDEHSGGGGLYTAVSAVRTPWSL